MTLPNNQPPNPAPEFGITGVPAAGTPPGGGNTIADLLNRTQTNISSILKTQMGQSPGWNASTASVYAGLRRGTPGNPVPLLLAGLEKFLNQVTGNNNTYVDLTHLYSDAASFFSGNWSSLSAVGTDLSNTWNDFWNGVFGGSATGKTAADMQTAAASVSSTANTASTNATNALSQWSAALTAASQATATAFGNYVTNTWTQLTSTWNSFWNGTYGTSATGKTAADVQTAAASTASTANTAGTNASSALSQFTSMLSAASQATATAFGTFLSTTATNLQTGWDAFWQGATGGTTTGHTTSDVKTAAAATASTANTASTNATTAGTNASSALSQLSSMLTAASQATATAFGNFLSTTATNLQTGWDDLWQGLTGGSTTGNTPATVKTAAASTSSTANTASSNASTALTNAAAAATSASTAQSGATTANANATSALSQLLAVPAQTVVPNLNSGASSVTIDHAGSGGSATNPSGSVSTPLTCTGTQTIGASASVMVATATFALVGSGTVVGNAQIAIGTQQMQSLGTYQISSVSEYVEFFILWNPPVGAGQTVTTTANGFNGGVASVSFESASYIGATSASTPVTNSGSGTALSLSLPAAIAGTMAVAAFSAGDVITKANTALSAFTKTQRGNTTVQVNSTQYGYQSLAFGDSAGASGGVTFGATGADSSAGWIGVGIVLSATSVIGSGFRVANTSTTVIPASSGYNILNGGIFGGTPTITSDYSYNSATTNTLTVKNAGWYAVTISLLTTTSYTSFMLGPALYQNGSLAQGGMRQYMSSGQSWILQSTFLVYCNAGDTLQPGYYSGVAYSLTFTGESTGAQCYWEVALLNRSLL